MCAQQDNMAGMVLDAVGTALSPLLTGKMPELPRTKLPKLKPCPFCGVAAELVGPFPMVGCSNAKCPVRPGVNTARLMVEGLDPFSAKGIRRLATLWNRRRQV